MDLSWLVPVSLALLLAEAIFSGSEIAIISANRVRLRQRAEEGDAGARCALRLLDAPEWLMGTILTCHNACFVTNVTLLTLAGLEFVGPTYGEVVTVGAIIPFLIVFGEVVPKSYCQDRADAVAPRLARLVWGARLIVYPFVWLISRLIRTLVGEDGGLKTPFVTRRELEVLVRESGGEGDVRTLERKMIGRIFSFSRLDARNVMVPMVDASAVGEDGTVEEVVERIQKDGHSRILVYRENIHHITGLVSAKDVLALGPEAGGPLRDKPGLILDAYYVPESKPAADLLAELSADKTKLAIVVDEYGACTGIVTLEDLVEEIVGEISDEYDVDEVRLYRRLGEERYLIDARMEVEVLREELSIPVPEGDYETLAGFLLEKFERIPQPGEEIVVDGWVMTVVGADERHIENVRLERKPEEAVETEAPQEG